jgi:hypothetical protein
MNPITASMDSLLQAHAEILARISRKAFAKIMQGFNRAVFIPYFERKLDSYIAEHASKVRS